MNKESKKLCLLIPNILPLFDIQELVFLYLIKSRSNNGGDSLSMVVFVQFLSILTATQLQRTAVEITF